jgi:hypothetical protein
MYFRIASATGYGSFDPAGLIELWERYGNSDPTRLLNLFSIAYYPLAEGNRPGLKFNRDALPQAWLPANISFRAPATAEKTLFAAGFPYRSSAVVEGEGEDWHRSGEAWELQSFSRTPDHAVMKLEAKPGESYLLWNERFNSGWKAYLNGKELSIATANTWAMAVKLSTENSHEPQLLEFIYQDSSERWGNWITLVTLAGILIGSAGTRLLPYRRSRG